MLTQRSLSKTNNDENTIESGSNLLSKTSQLENTQNLPFMGLAGDNRDQKDLDKFDRKNSLINFQSPERKVHRSESLFDPPKVSDLVI